MPLNAVELDQNVVRQILSYFVHSLRTADTLEGIARWRLLQERVRYSVRQTEAALRWLVEKGFLEDVFPAASRSSIFRLNPNRLGDAKRFLAGAEKKDIREASSSRNE